MLQIKEKYLMDNGLNSFMMENHFEYFYHLFLPHHQWHSKLYYFTENLQKCILYALSEIQIQIWEEKTWT